MRKFNVKPFPAVLQDGHQYWHYFSASDWLLPHASQLCWTTQQVLILVKKFVEQVCLFDCVSIQLCGTTQQVLIPYSCKTIRRASLFVWSCINPAVWDNTTSAYSSKAIRRASLFVWLCINPAVLDNTTSAYCLF